VFVPAQPGQGTAYCQNTYGKLVAWFPACCSPDDQQTTEYKLGVGIFAAATSTCGPDLEGSIAKGRLEYDAVAAQTCFDAWATVFGSACNGNPIVATNSAALASSLETCKNVFRGRVAANGACARDTDCVDGLTCLGWTPSSDGTCATPPALSQACGEGLTDAALTLNITFPFGDHPGCAPGAYCNKICLAQSNPGGSCSKDEQCAGGKLCHAGTCGDVGDSDQNGSCKTNDDCKTGLYCQAPGLGQLGTCLPKQADGATCTSSVSSCKGRCDRPDGGATGTCKSFCGSG
jgi:hypothetical protein